MTSLVLRRTSTVLLAACAAVLAVAMFAGPATATEGGDAGAGAAAHEPAGFGSGQWDGMLLAGACGVLLGLFVFAMSNPGEIHRDGH